MIRVGAATLAACWMTIVSPDARAVGDATNPFDDPPPRRATQGIVDCPAPPVRRWTPDDARREAHQRIERGTSCWLAGQCAPGGDYRGDGELNDRIAAAISADARFVDTSLWVETLRKFVTIKGCLARADQGPALEALVRTIDGVKLVWQEAVPRASR